MALSSVPIQPPVSPATSLIFRRWSTTPLYAEHIWRTSLVGWEDNLRRYLWIGMSYVPAATEKTPSSWIAARDWGTRIMTLRQIQPKAMCPKENSLHFLAFRSQWLKSERLVEWPARIVGNYCLACFKLGWCLSQLLTELPTKECTPAPRRQGKSSDNISQRCLPTQNHTSTRSLQRVVSLFAEIFQGVAHNCQWW